MEKWRRWSAHLERICCEPHRGCRPPLLDACRNARAATLGNGLHLWELHCSPLRSVISSSELPKSSESRREAIAKCSFRSAALPGMVERQGGFFGWGGVICFTKRPCHDAAETRTSGYSQDAWRGCHRAGAHWRMAQRGDGGRQAFPSVEIAGLTYPGDVMSEPPPEDGYILSGNRWDERDVVNHIDAEMRAKLSKWDFAWPRISVAAGENSTCSGPTTRRSPRAAKTGGSPQRLEPQTTFDQYVRGWRVPVMEATLSFAPGSFRSTRIGGTSCRCIPSASGEMTARSTATTIDLRRAPDRRGRRALDLAADVGDEDDAGGQGDYADDGDAGAQDRRWEARDLLPISK
jgi:hypothetical protein